MKVLVADDSGVMRKIIIRALNACGVTDIVEAGDGAEAIAKFGETSVDLVMTDWNMPNKTGLDEGNSRNRLHCADLHDHHGSRNEPRQGSDRRRRERLPREAVRERLAPSEDRQVRLRLS